MEEEAGHPPFAASIAVEVATYGVNRYFVPDRSFEATCANDIHLDGTRRCRLSRHATRAEGASPGNRRPCGQLGAWLSHLFSHNCLLREDHRSPFFIMGLDLETRSQWRDTIATLPNGPELPANERTLELDELAEPF